MAFLQKPVLMLPTGHDAAPIFDWERVVAARALTIKIVRAVQRTLVSMTEDHRSLPLSERLQFNEQDRRPIARAARV